ncbi:MAG: hypothetical protein AB7F99_12950 [Vicinamibacterales bacterium]
MRLLQKLLLGPLVLGLLLPLDARAQLRHAVDPSHLSDVVAEHAAGDATNRAVVRDALSRTDVRKIASRLGVDAAELDRAAGLLSGADLARAADAARQLDQDLVGGQSAVVLSTTTIIIILLVVIVIVAVAD